MFICMVCLYFNLQICVTFILFLFYFTSCFTLMTHLLQHELMPVKVSKSKSLFHLCLRLTNTPCLNPNTRSYCKTSPWMSSLAEKVSDEPILTMALIDTVLCMCAVDSLELVSPSVVIHGVTPPHVSVYHTASA